MMLMQVMDSLYQARVKKGETDFLIDQLKETFHYLTVQNKVERPLCGQGTTCCDRKTCLAAISVLSLGNTLLPVEMLLAAVYL